MRATQAVGGYGERVAERALTDLGMEILDRNWRCPAGEIDLVAHDRGCDEIVVVEVKTRRSATFGSPLEAVTPVKLARLRRLAGQWVAEHGRRAAGVRIDVVGVVLTGSGPATVEHVRGVG